MNEKQIFEYLRKNLSIKLVDKSEGSMFGGEIPSTTAFKIELILKDPEGKETLISETTELSWYDA